MNRIARFSLVAVAVIAAMTLACGGGLDLPEAAPTDEPAGPRGLVTATPDPSAPGPEPTSVPEPNGEVLNNANGAPGNGDSEPNVLEQSRYTVEPGDSPFLIAEKVGVPPDERGAWVSEMLAINGVDATSLQVGQELILPPF